MNTMEENKLYKEIEARLSEANIFFERNLSIGGFEPDFIVYAPDGRKIAIDIKSWRFSGFTKRAGRQAQLFQEALGADKGFVVLEELKRNLVSEGVVTVEGLIPALLAEFEKSVSKKSRSAPQKTEKLIFAAMPFDPAYEDTFFLAMAPAAQAVGATCTRVDREEFQGNIVEEVKHLIQKSAAVIIDLSEAKPNVLYEAGFAHALQRPCVHICSTPLDKLPFDVAQWKTIPYSRGQVNRLKKPLIRALKAAIES
ncbi:MAG: hypothetical protein Kow0042_22280 [Calditrichia bacterium]